MRDERRCRTGAVPVTSRWGTEDGDGGPGHAGRPATPGVPVREAPVPDGGAGPSSTVTRVNRSTAVWTAVWGASVAAVPLALWNVLSVTDHVSFWRFGLGLLLTVPGLLAGRWLPGSRPLVVCAVLGAVVAPVLTRDGWRLLTAALAWTGTIAVPWLVGRYRRQNRALVRAAEERAERSERERHRVADRVRAAERARIARDMHDSLGHDLTLLAVRIAALEMAADTPERHRAALGEVRGGAADATARLRDIIGLLRADADPDADGPHAGGPASGPDGTGTAPPPTESVAELVRRTVASGVTVRVEHLDEPPPRAMSTVYRVVQEALTNATKHAPGAPVTLRLARVADGLVVEVTNPAPDRSPAAAPRNAVGHGLLGLDERMRLAGGSLEAGPLPDGGFRVTARMGAP